MVDLLAVHRVLHLGSPSRFLIACGCLLVAGCVGGDDYQTVTSDDADRAEAHADHDHDEHVAPHGGHLIELGEHQYNAEVVLEAEPKQLVVYVLDAHAENAVAIDGPTLTFTLEEGAPITLEAQALEDDAEGKSSRFVAAGAVVDGIADIEDLHGGVQVAIDGNDFSGELSHDHDHDHEAGHDHDDADHSHGEGDDE